MTRRIITKQTGWAFLLFLPLAVFAQTVYIDDKVKIGLHQDNGIDSPIIKLLPAGTALEVVKRDTPFTQVKEPAGASGWIDNRYLVDAAPGRAQLLQLQEKAEKLELELAALKSGGPTTPAVAATEGDSGKFAVLLQENTELKQQLQSEQLKSGELQAQAAELRNQLSQAGASSAEETEVEAMDENTATGITALLPFSGAPDWRSVLIGIVACLLIGMLGGVYLMDWMSRRRHGGFRI